MYYGRSHLKYSFTAFFVIAVDQVTKELAYASKFGGFLNSFRPVFGKLLLPNYNFAFSIALPHALAYTLYALVLIAFCVWYYRADKTLADRFGFYLILGGAISNIVDRVMLGYVRDFISAFWGNVFNVADIAIVTGIVLILIANFQKSSAQPLQK